jgi:hypothetical protein
MERIKIEEGDRTPGVLFDADRGLLSITGRSTMEDARSFYKEIIEGLDDYAKTPTEILDVTLDYEYFNTASAVQIMQLFKKLDEQDYDFSVVWVYEEDDEDMLEAGYDFDYFLTTAGIRFIEKPEKI